MTEDDEIQDEEGVKSVAPPPTAHTNEAIGACLVAVCSLWQYKWRHRGDFSISSPNLRYGSSKGWALVPQGGRKIEKKFFFNFLIFLVELCLYMSELHGNQNFRLDCPLFSLIIIELMRPPILREQGQILGRSGGVSLGRRSEKEPPEIAKKAMLLTDRPPNWPTNNLTQQHGQVNYP